MGNGIVINDDHERVDGFTRLVAGDADQDEILVTAGAYSGNDVVGGLIVFDVHSAGGGGVITDVYLTDANNQSKPYTLHIFDGQPTEILDNAAYGTALVIADQRKKIGEISLVAARYTTDNSLDWARVPDVDLKFAAAQGELYMYAENLDAPTQGDTDDIQISMLIQKN